MTITNIITPLSRLWCSTPLISEPITRISTVLPSFGLLRIFKACVTPRERNYLLIRFSRSHILPSKYSVLKYKLWSFQYLSYSLKNVLSVASLTFYLDIISLINVLFYFIHYGKRYRSPLDLSALNFSTTAERRPSLNSTSSIPLSYFLVTEKGL